MKTEIIKVRMCKVIQVHDEVVIKMPFKEFEMLQDILGRLSHTDITKMGLSTKHTILIEKLFNN